MVSTRSTGRWRRKTLARIFSANGKSYRWKWRTTFQLYKIKGSLKSQIPKLNNSQELLGPVFEGNWFLTTAASSVVASFFVVLFMSPFDVVSTRIFNQPVDPVTKNGLYYKGTIHALGKIWKEEGSTAYLKVFRLNET